MFKRDSRLRLRCPSRIALLREENLIDYTRLTYGVQSKVILSFPTMPSKIQSLR